MDTKQARLLAKLAHRGQRYGDGDYFERHVEDVVARVRVDHRSWGDHIIVAYFHDAIEDGALTLEELREFGCTELQLKALDAITRRPDERYNAYLVRVAGNDIAALVKRCDLESNLEHDPPPELAKRYARALHSLDWLKRYKRAMGFGTPASSKTS